MDGLLAYAVASAAVLVVLWGGFRLLLRSQKTFRVNRILLCLILYFSLCAPVLFSRLSIPVSDEAPEVVGLMTLAGVSVLSDGADSAAVAGDYDIQQAVRWLPHVLAVVYVAGVVAVLVLRVLVPAAAAAVMLLRGRRYRALVGGRAVTVVSVPAIRGRKVEPMSWLGVVILPAEEDFENDSYVIRHEAAHIRMRHSALLLNASLMVCLQWFNPAAWLLLRDLKENSEFEADDAVLSSGVDRRGYQFALVGQAAKGMAVSQANLFRNSNLCRRIKMIQKSVPGRKVYARLLYVVPVVFAAAVLFVKPQTAANAMPAEKDEMVTLNGDGLEVRGQMAESPKYVSEDAVVVPFTLVEQRPEFMGGSANNFSRWISAALQYPSDAVGSGASARVIVQFTVSRAGNVSDIRVRRMEVKGTRIADFDYSVFSDAAVDLISKSPEWTPGRIDGKPVDVLYNIPVDFQISRKE